jgi:hypothetical protein
MTAHMGRGNRKGNSANCLLRFSNEINPPDKPSQGMRCGMTNASDRFNHCLARGDDAVCFGLSKWVTNQQELLRGVAFEVDVQDKAMHSRWPAVHW